MVTTPTPTRSQVEPHANFECTQTEAANDARSEARYDVEMPVDTAVKVTVQSKGGGKGKVANVWKVYKARVA